MFYKSAGAALGKAGQAIGIERIEHFQIGLDSRIGARVALARRLIRVRVVAERHRLQFLAQFVPYTLAKAHLLYAVAGQVQVDQRVPDRLKHGQV